MPEKSTLSQVADLHVRGLQLILEGEKLVLLTEVLSSSHDLWLTVEVNRHGHVVYRVTDGNSRKRYYSFTDIKRAYDFYREVRAAGCWLSYEEDQIIR
jgi:hypothetical protein